MKRYAEDWEAWGRLDPYFAVLTEERYRGGRLSEEDRTAFFESGRAHVRDVVEILRRRFEVDSRAGKVLDFGCGVGRLAMAFAEGGASVTGVDVSPTMLAAARKNAAEVGLGARVRFIETRELSAEPRASFDLVHSYITFQHIPQREGMKLVGQLLDLVREEGLVAIHLIHGRPGGVVRRALARIGRRLPGAGWVINARLGRPLGTPQMQMNVYDLGACFSLLAERGFTEAWTVATDHGGFRGVFLFSRKKSRR